MKMKINSITRIIFALCGTGLIAVLFVPLWTIDLIAPQYPEGLTLVITPQGLAGNVDIINGLNHYIGMKTLHNEDFIEFTILPYIIAAFALMFLLAAAVGKKKMAAILVALYILFGIVAMVDFYKWEYDYGHNLNPDAAIKVPGMVYQPPLIGYKQLLNFSAYSFPSAGGWIFIGVGIVSLITLFAEYRRKNKSNTALTKPVMLIAPLLALLTGCSSEPSPIKYGTDNCSECKMTISDQRFGGEIITKKGKIYKFDDMHCMIEFTGTEKTATTDIAAIYLINFAAPATLINANTAFLLKSDDLKSPMAGNIAAFSSRETRAQMSVQYKGYELTWKDVLK